MYAISSEFVSTDKNVYEGDIIWYVLLIWKVLIEFKFVVIKF